MNQGLEFESPYSTLLKCLEYRIMLLWGNSAMNIVKIVFKIIIRCKKIILKK